MIKTQKTIIDKQKDFAFGKPVFLLGIDERGIKYWLEGATWDCSWYWGFGYVETYQNNQTPSKAKDIDSHQHINSSFIGRISSSDEYIHNIYDTPVLTKTTFTEKEGWVLTELFKTFYTLMATSELYHTGGARTTTNPLRDVLKNDAEEKRINETLLPKVFEEIYKILSPE